MSLSRGWARATAHPWNDEGGVALRLLRGSSDFLRQAALQMDRLEPDRVYSPALYRGPARSWRRAGFVPAAELVVMERPLGAPLPSPPFAAAAAVEPDWDQIVAVDKSAFEGWWAMGRHGLIEATEATPRFTVLTVRSGPVLAGYALVGAQLAVSFLQRVAVRPEQRGRGIGVSLVRQALLWAGGTGARAMVLNVRPDNGEARRLYRREGFSETGASLQVLRFGS